MTSKQSIESKVLRPKKKHTQCDTEAYRKSTQTTAQCFRSRTKKEKKLTQITASTRRKLLQIYGARELWSNTRASNDEAVTRNNK